MLSAKTTSIQNHNVKPLSWRERHFRQWLNRRIPPTSSVTLNQKKIFILPTKQGLWHLFIAFLILLIAINYENNLAYALCFLLSSLFITTVLYTFRNLSGLTLKSGISKACYCGEDAEFTIRLSRPPSTSYQSVHLSWPDSAETIVDIINEESINAKIYLPSKQRGLLKPGRLTVETHFPLGLLRAWTLVDLNFSTIVYPKPIESESSPQSYRQESDEGEFTEKEGVEDFSGQREYQPGDPLKHLNWKHYARNEELLTKQFSSYVDKRLWLDWDSFPGMDKENRLSRLCYWVIHTARSDDEYGLRLPGLEIPQSRGEQHRIKCLEALALFE